MVTAQVTRGSETSTAQPVGIAAASPMSWIRAEREPSADLVASAAATSHAARHLWGCTATTPEQPVEIIIDGVPSNTVTIAVEGSGG